MAASALVAVPEPAGALPKGTAGAIDPATVSAVALALPSGETAMSTRTTKDLATDPVVRQGSEPAYLVPGRHTVPTGRPRPDQPAPKAGVVVKNFWRFDPDISWYGSAFFGSGTACGQTYTRSIMGVAHRTLPCGTLVTFRNPANGRQVTVPVIDRGPYVAGRTWDMSRGLCDYLDHCYTGSIEWRWGSRH
jgi:rare lipoprotein A (peptidoglycan hydrolase)